MYIYKVCMYIISWQALAPHADLNLVRLFGASRPTHRPRLPHMLYLLILYIHTLICKAPWSLTPTLI